MRDKMSKGRHRVASGEKHSRAKLTDEQVRTIRDVHGKGLASYRQLAIAYGMSVDGIRFIVKGLRRKGA